MSPPVTAGVVGGSGFTGGELLRLIAGHPDLELAYATSRQFERKTVGYVHPNLRELELRFVAPDALEAVDVLFTATPHGVSMQQIEAFTDTAPLVVDLSADFRLPDAALYDEWYDGHDAPSYLAEATYGLVELTRAELPGARIIAAGGCNATAVILGLKPLVDAGIMDASTRFVADVKVGSSEGGAGGGRASSHPERGGVVRPYAPTGHRHEAEIAAYLGLEGSFTAHAVEMTRGASATCHVFADAPVSTKQLWAAYRESYAAEPFVRVVAGGGGVYRYPEPKAVAGTNMAEVGFARDPRNGRIVVFSAIDNMLKGSAGQAVHAMNVALGLDETAGLQQVGYHPIGSP